VGRLKEKYLSDGVLEYKKRLSRFCKLNIIETEPYSQKKEDTEGEIKLIKQTESDNLLKHKSGYMVALDIEGEAMTSPELSARIENLKSKGIGEITFVIGGSHGLSEDFLQGCDSRLSFSKLTFPHQLMRLILLEQLYRAFMIGANCTYHK
jgi:23S rRNA (pseudouridine1915-N3)-methyltransferase